MEMDGEEKGEKWPVSRFWANWKRSHRSCDFLGGPLVCSPGKLGTIFLLHSAFCFVLFSPYFAAVSKSTQEVCQSANYSPVFLVSSPYLPYPSLAQVFGSSLHFSLSPFYVPARAVDKCHLRCDVPDAITHGSNLGPV